MRFVLVWTVLLSSATSAFGQKNLEVNGGWAHASGNFGTDGFGVGAAYWLTPHVSLAFNYDGLGIHQAWQRLHSQAQARFRLRVIFRTSLRAPASLSRLNESRSTKLIRLRKCSSEFLI